MNSFIETLNQWGADFLSYAWPMLWQSSLLIAVLAAFDFTFRRKLRASIRYALWLVVLVKLCIPPTLALPTSPAWWLHKTPPPLVAKSLPHYTITYDNGPLPEMPQTPLPTFVPPKPVMTSAAWLLVVSVVISSILLLWLLVRWWQITRLVQLAEASERLAFISDEAQKIIGMKLKVHVKLTANSMSPAVCGLFRPAILIPQSLAENFSGEQLRAVLLHELIHLRRRDVWLNFIQALLQIVYWWHPLVWLANARIRRVREEAVDDAVMLALRDEAEAYAPTLLEVAKLALNRPLASLGLVGILESRHSLRQRIERLVDFRPPRKAGLTLVSLLGILAFTAVAVPMGDGPGPAEQSDLPAQNTNAVLTTATGILPDSNFQNAIRALKQRTGSETLSEPEVTTTSGHGANRIRTDNISAPLFQVVPESSNQLAMTFKLIHPMRQDELKGKFLAAGVRIPPTVFYYNENGMLLVRSSEAQLALANRIVLQLNGYSPEEIEASDKQFPAQIQEIRREANSGTNLFSRHFKISPAAFNSTMRNTPGLQTNNFSIMAKSFFTTLGVDWESPKGKAIFYNDRVGELFVRATLTDFDTVERALVVIQSGETNSNIVGNTNFPISTNVIENKIEAGTLVQDGRLLYEMGKMDEAEVKLKSALALDPENAAAKYYLGLVQAARQHPTNSQIKTGRQNIVGKLNHIQLDPFGPFIGVSLGEVVRQLNEMARRNDPEKTGVDIVILTNSLSSRPVGIDSVIINLPGPLMNVTLEGALKAIVQNTSLPLKYSILDDMIVLSMKDGSDIPMLYSRHFRVDANKFMAAMRNVPGIKTNNISVMARDFFKTLGVDLDVPGKSIFYGDRLGELFVRATKQDLDTIENALEVFSRVAPQIHIKARFLEVPKGTLAGLDNVIPVPNQPAQSNQVAGLVGILADKNFRTVLRNLEARPGVETLAEPEVVTTSGRQTQMRASTEAYNDIVNDVFVTRSKESNLMLDVVPYVLSDGYTINVTAMPLISELTGYVKPTNSIIALNKAGNVVQLPAVLPNFTVQQVRQGVATLNVWDGQTVVLGGLPDKKYVRDKETVVRPEPSDKELLVFITVNIVDPAGNRIHSDDELPFAKDSIPSQPK